jgi:hypothetical protein
MDGTFPTQHTDYYDADISGDHLRGMESGEADGAGTGPAAEFME